MARKIKLPAPKKIRRDPFARALAAGTYKPKVVPREGVYRRRAKHLKRAMDGSD